MVIRSIRLEDERTMNLYFISGLGADKRIFQNLVLPEVFKIYYIDWVTVSENESMESYCRRLSSQINTLEPFSLVGLSFGGVIAIEMSKFFLRYRRCWYPVFALRKKCPGIIFSWENPGYIKFFLHAYY
ncbi:MAG: hypothetical protein WDM78_16440 [Puia sp.]